MNEDETRERSLKWKKILSVVKFIVLIIILIGIPAYILLFQRAVIAHFRSFDDVLNYMLKYKTEGIFVYFGAQILQIMISVLPGQVFQFVAGYMFGFWPGLLYSIIGAFLGSTITYYLAKFLGEDAMHLFFGQEKMKYFIERLNSKRAYIIVFLIYLIPGLPKDLVCYAAGVSDMKYKAFIILSTVGRIPGMCGSLLFGAMYLQKSYVGMIVIACVVTVALILCFIFRKRLQGVIDRIYNKIS